MGVTLERVQNKFACIIGELCNEPYVLSQFAIWVDLRIAEYKANGNISLDCSGTSDSPVWLIGLSPPKPVQSERVLQRHPRLSANRIDRHTTSSQDFSNYSTDAPDFISDRNNAVVVKDEPDDAEEIFPVSLHRHDRPMANDFHNTTRRKRPSNSENAVSQNKLKKLSADVHFDSVTTKEASQENQSLMSVIGAGDEHLELVNIHAENLPLDNSTHLPVDYEISEIPSMGEHSTDETFNISSSLSALNKTDHKACSKDLVLGILNSPLVSDKPLQVTVDRSSGGKIYHRALVANGRIGVQELKGGTLANTRIALSRFRLWLSQNTTEERPIEDIPPAELDAYLVPFYSTVTQIGGRDYSKRSLQSLRERIERHLRMHDYPASILRSPQFLASQNAFKKRSIELEKTARSRYHVQLNKS